MKDIDEDIFKTNIFTLVMRFQKTLQGVFRTSWSRPIYSSWSYFFKTFSRRVVKTSSTGFQDVFKMSCKNLFKISSRRFAKMSSTHFQYVSSC